MSVNTPLAAALLRLTLDLSGGDPALAATTRAILADPPTTLEEIGYYGMENAPADERALRAVLFRLIEAGHIHGFEDKYVSDMIDILIREGLVPADHGSAALRAFTGDGLMAMFEEDTDTADAAAMLAARFPAAVRALEDAVASTGRRMLYVDLPLGDTLHYVFVSPEVARTWENVVLYRTGDHPIAITAPRWDILWGFYTYSFLFDDGAPTPDLPPAPPGGSRTLEEAGF